VNENMLIASYKRAERIYDMKSDRLYAYFSELLKDCKTSDETKKLMDRIPPSVTKVMAASQLSQQLEEETHVKWSVER